MHQVVEMTREEKESMYSALPKEELVQMIFELEKYIPKTEVTIMSKRVSALKTRTDVAIFSFCCGALFMTLLFALLKT